MASPNPAEGWISCRRTLWFLAIAAGFGAGLAGCHRAPPLLPQEAEGSTYIPCGVRIARRQRSGLEKVPPDLHDVFSRTALPSGAPATDPDVKRIILSGKGNDAFLCGTIQRRPDE